MKNIAILLVLSVIITGNLFSQKVISGVSESKYVNIIKDSPKKPPYIGNITKASLKKPPYIEIEEGSLQFTDKDGNYKIDANETSYLNFVLKNTGMGPGLDIKVQLQETNNIYGLQYDKIKLLGILEPGKTQKVQLPLIGKMSLQDGTASFNIRIEEANGFGIDPVILEVTTQSFLEPLVKVIEHSVTSEKGKIQKKRIFYLQVLVQNMGQGFADDVSISINLPENILPVSANQVTTINSFEPGEQKIIEYSLIANNNYASDKIPFSFAVREKYGKYAKDTTIILVMNQAVSKKKVVVQSKDKEKTPIVKGSLTSIVDKNIPENYQKKPNRFALIIGNEDYSGTLNAEVNVEFARNDAKIFKEYAKNTMGIEEKNIYLLLDATAGRMRKYINLVTALIKRMGNNAELIFYYAGHGFPDENTKAPYLIPVDVDATNLDPAIRLSEIYKNFAETGAKRVTVFLDACFSGGGRNQGLLAARSVVIKPKDELISGNMVVFSASSGEQSALPYNKQKHGMFTYFLLKKLQETEGNVTYKELADYLLYEVGIESLRDKGKEQDPEVNVSAKIQNEWQNWDFK